MTLATARLIILLLLLPNVIRFPPLEELAVLPCSAPAAAPELAAQVNRPQELELLELELPPAAAALPELPKSPPIVEATADPAAVPLS